MVSNTSLPSYSCESSDQKTLFTKRILYQKTFFFYQTTLLPKNLFTKHSFKKRLFTKKIPKKIFVTKNYSHQKNLCLPKKIVKTTFLSHQNFFLPKTIVHHNLYFSKIKVHHNFFFTKPLFSKSVLTKKNFSFIKKTFF